MSSLTTTEVLYEQNEKKINTIFDFIDFLHRIPIEEFKKVFLQKYLWNLYLKDEIGSDVMMYAVLNPVLYQHFFVMLPYYNCNSANTHGYTILHFAVIQNNYHLVKTIMMKMRWDALVKVEHIDEVKLLLSLGKENLTTIYDIKSRLGRTPLDLAYFYGCDKSLKALQLAKVTKTN